jgi:four helix bundle protein
MATAKRFEDLIVWQNAQALRKDLYAVVKAASLSKNFTLSDQLMRAALSTMANISEGFERGTTKEFINFLHISKGSNSEVRNHLYAAFDDGHISENELNTYLTKSNEISNQLSKFITYLRLSEYKTRTSSNTNTVSDF